MNTVLFYRILSVDFSGIFRSASFSPREHREQRDCAKEQGGVRSVFPEEDRPSSSVN